MRFGIFDHMEFRDGSLGQLYAERLEMLERADRAGFWCYHKAEHHFIRLDAAPSSSVFLAAASQRTARLRFGPLVALLPFYDPLRLIEEICALDHLSGGRLEFGIGKGISPAEHDLWGHDRDEARDRFEETFQVVREGLSSDVLNHSGHFHSYADVPVVMKPLQQPRPAFWYPGNFDYAGQHRLNSVTAGPLPLVAQNVKRYRELVAAVKPEDDWNPGVGEPTIGSVRHLYVADTDEAAKARAMRAYARYHENLVTLFKKYEVEFSQPGDPSFGGNAELAMQVQALVAGSPETIREHVAAAAEQVESDYFIAAFAWGDLSHEESMRSLDLFATEVMPHFG